MPRKKTTSAAEPVSPTATQEKISLTVEVDKKLYEQIKAASAACGYVSVDEWLMEAIMDKV